MERFMSNIWVEFWDDMSKKSGSHAQMNTQKVFIEPDPNTISRRFFDSNETAQKFARSMIESGRVARVKKDRSL